MKFEWSLKLYALSVAVFACATVPTGDSEMSSNASATDQLRPLLRTPVQVTVGNDANFAPDISFDGRYLVHTTSINGNKEISFKDRKKRSHRLLTNHPADDFAPALSPDGKTVAFLTRRLDAAGDVAFADTVPGFFSVGIESNIRIASRPESEELAPAWFPDGKSVIVPVRDQPSKAPMLMRLTVEKLTWEKIAMVRGEYPNVSPDGKQLLYVREGRIFEFDMGLQVEHAFENIGGGIWARPRFAEGQKAVVAVRYSDDTNRDGVLDGSDHGTIWRMALSTEGKVSSPEQLTSASINAYLPELRSEGLYVTLDAKGALEIFKLPTLGQARSEWASVPEDQWLWNLKNPYDRVFALDTMAAAALAGGNRKRSIELRLRSLEERLDVATTIEMDIALDDALRGREKDSDMVQLVDAFRYLSRAAGDYSALKNGTANVAAKRRLETVVAKLDEVETQAINSHRASLSNEVREYLNVKKAELLLKLGKPSETRTRLGKIGGNASPRTLALAKLVESEVDAESKNFEESETILLNITRSKSVPTDMKREAADAYVKSLVDRKVDAEGFERAKQQAKGTTFVSTLLHVETAQRFIRNGKPKVGVNEYRQILVDHCKEDPQFIPEISTDYVRLAMNYGGIEVADESLSQAAKCVEGNPIASVEMKQVRAQALVDYGQRLMREREYGQALKLFKTASEVDRSNLGAWRGLVDASWRRKVLSGVQKYFDEQLKANPHDFVASYGRGYVETYAVDEAKSPADKIAAVDRGIEMISNAEELDPTQIFPHQTLGWLYMQRSHWVERLRKDGGFSGRTSALWAKLRSFAGRPEDNDVEMAIDSFQAALFLSEDRSQERANIIQNLAEAYYQLENHQKALTFYAERLRQGKEHPFLDANTEASVLRLAGRSAFQVDELDLAEQLQRKALVVWKDGGNDEQISYSMDALALTLREEKKYDEAIQIYQEIYERHRAAKRQAAAQQSLSNKGYCLFMAGKNEDALKTFQDSDQLPIDADEKVSAKAEGSDAIAVDIGGQSSASKGFDETARKNMNLTFEARILENLHRNDEAAQKYRDKIVLLQNAAKDANAGKKKSITEEIVITRNNLGWLLANSGHLADASTEFHGAMVEAKDLRVPDQKMTRDEAVHANLWARMELRRAVAGEVAPTVLQEVVTALKKIETDARPEDPKAPLNPDAKQILSEVTTVRAAIEAALAADDETRTTLLSTAINQASTYVTVADQKDLKRRENQLLALGAGINVEKGDFANQMREVRKLSLDATADADLVWRGRVAAWHQRELKLKGFDEAVGRDSIFGTAHDQLAVQTEFAAAFDEALDDPSRVSVLRGFFRVNALSTLNELMKLASGSFVDADARDERQKKVKDYFAVKSSEDFKKSLNGSDRLIGVVDDGDTFRAILFDPTKGWQAMRGDDVPAQLAAASADSRRTFLSCIGARCAAIREKLASKENRISFVATPEIIPHLVSLRRLPMSSVVVVASKETGSEDVFKNQLSTHDVRVVTNQSWAELESSVAEAHITAFSMPLNVNATNPSAAELRNKDAGSGGKIVGMPLVSTVGRKPWFATGIIFPKVTGAQKEAFNIEALNYLSVWLLEREVGTALVKFAPPKDQKAPTAVGIDSTSVSRELQAELSSDTLRPAPGYLLVGDSGLFDDEAKAFAAKHIGETRERALDAKDDGDLVAAKRLFMEAAHYAKILGQDDGAIALYESLIKLLFQSQEYQSALRFQEQKIEIMRHKNAAPRAIAGAEMEAGILAVRANLAEPARVHIGASEKFYIAEDEDLDLGKVHHYYGLCFEIESKFEETIGEYNKSREFFLKGADKTQAAQKILDIGNVYKERLGNFPVALEYYNQAYDAFAAIKMNDRLSKVQIDRANTLMAMGETRWAINVMENRVLNVLDPKTDPAQWTRAAQITANAYYQAGLYADAQGFIKKILVETKQIKDTTQRVTTNIDARNLDAMITEKLGNHAAGIRIFEEILADARKSHLRGKEAMLLNNIGYWNREAGQVQESIKQFKEALTIDEAAKSEADQAYDLRNLGLSYTLLGDLTQARAMVEKALAISSRMKLAYNAAYCLFALAEISERQEKHDDAIQFFEKARKGAETAFLQDFVWRAYAASGFVKVKKGDFVEGTKDLESAIKVIEKLRAGLASESSKTGFASDRGVQDVYNEIVFALMKQNKVSEAWNFSERGRARAFIDAMGGRALAFGDKDLDDALDQERKLRSDVELQERKLALLPANSPDMGKVQTGIDESRQKYQQLLIVIQGKWPKVMPFLGVSPITVELVTSKIGSESALLEYMVLKDQTAFWVIANGSIHGGLIPTGRARIRTLIDQYRELMQNFAAVGIPGKELSDILLAEPMKMVVSSSSRELVIVPHSELHYLPFAALPLDKEYLLDRYPVSYLESAEMVRFAPDPARTITHKSRVLAFGNPARGVDLDLPFAEREVKALTRSFPNIKSEIGKDATIEALKAGIATADVFHFAGHGEFSTVDPSASRLLFAGTDGPGDLTVKTILTMKFPTALVTLSACETGLGKLTSGDEMVGFNRAFFFAGTESLITSLWRISDVASSVTVKRFYAGMSKGTGRAAALREAQLVVKKYYPHPAYWSAFKLSGVAK